MNVIIIIIIGTLILFSTVLFLVKLLKKRKLEQEENHYDSQGYKITKEEYDRRQEYDLKDYTMGIPFSSIGAITQYLRNPPKEVIIENSDFFKEIIDKVETKSKAIKIGDILTGLEQNAINKENKIKNLASKIVNANSLDIDFWVEIEKAIALMTDEEREELQQFINSKKIVCQQLIF